jgi:D-apionolactonase
MADNPSLAIRLYGTEEPVVAPVVLTAGPLSAELEAGNLRYIRFNGVEMIRAISFIVRDRNWGTYNPEISNLQVSQKGEVFHVTYDAVTRDANQEFRYSAEISGARDGALRFQARGRAVTDFETNRTGFVVLHPIDGVAGEPATIEDTEGDRIESRFPEFIDPVQPMMNLRAITHSFAPGARVRCLMEGDTFEMEDQRNWTDASYKTYVRPLELPWPYVLPGGSETEQAVSLTVEGSPPARAVEDTSLSLRIGERIGRVPPLGLGLDPHDANAALSEVEALRSVSPAHLICHHDPRRGHDGHTLKACAAVADALGAAAWLEAVIAEVDGFEEEIAALGETVTAMGSPFATVLVSPASDLKCTLPGSKWPPCPPADELYRATRKAFPDARLGGGMFSYFTELNRKRPPVDLLDFVSFTTSPLVHAGDDRSVMESLEALAHVARSVRQISGEKPYAVGPSAIGMRMNPYGAAPMENPENIRQAMNRNDPRQRGLLGAAWAVGYFAHFAHGGAEAITLGDAAGPFGLLYTPEPWPQPWFDHHGGLFPVFHVIRGLARLANAHLRQVDVWGPGKVSALVADGPDGLEVWLANLADARQSVVLPAQVRSASVLDAEHFSAATEDAEFLDRMKPANGTVELGAFAIARLRT